MSEIWVDCCCCHWKSQLMFLSLSLSGPEWWSVQPTSLVCSKSVSGVFGFAFKGRNVLDVESQCSVLTG